MDTKAPKHSSAKVLLSLRDLIPTIDERRITRALSFAEELYGDKKLSLLEDGTLFEHALRTTQFLAEFCRDEDAIIACILQHALKVPDSDLEEIAKEFGRTVRDMVSRVHLLSHLYTTDWRKSVDDMKIMLVSVSDDIRVLLIALAVACQFLERLPEVKPQYRMRLCRQALQLFAPVASRLGIYALKYRLERTAFPECYPTDAQHIGQQVKRLHDEHGQFLNTTAGAIREFLIAEGVETEVMAREKHSYSIFQKMHTKSVTALEKITDLFAVRVIVPEVADCYQALGLLHRIGTPISHRFKDYISFPKPNGYQSLHTCLMGLPHAPKNLLVEVQIRTKAMHRDAEYGIASHWIYKETGKNSVLRSAKKMELSDVLLKQHAVGAKPGVNFSDDVTLVDHIYVLTPKGDIIELPEGGSPLDFAFSLHTEIGLKYKAARVNGTIAPISYQLENGDVVEILTHKHPRPMLQWLEQIVTPSARSKLKAYFFSHNRSEFVQQGKEALNSELVARRLSPLDTELRALGIVDGKALSIKERENLLAKVGMGSVRAGSVLQHLTLKHVPMKQVKNAVPRARVKKAPLSSLVAMEGEPLNMPHRFAKCCSPDAMKERPDIMGIVTRLGSVTIHKKNCRMVKAANPERKLKMRWVE